MRRAYLDVAKQAFSARYNDESVPARKQVDAGTGRTRRPAPRQVPSHPPTIDARARLRPAGPGRSPTSSRTSCRNAPCRRRNSPRRTSDRRSRRGTAPSEPGRHRASGSPSARVARAKTEFVYPRIAERAGFGVYHVLGLLSVPFLVVGNHFRGHLRKPDDTYTFPL